MLREADALYVWGGNVLYLCYWMKRSDSQISCRR